jgi:hypothetical protein
MVSRILHCLKLRSGVQLTEPTGPLALDSLGTSAAHTPGTCAQQTPAWTAGRIHIMIC